MVNPSSRIVLNGRGAILVDLNMFLVTASLVLTAKSTESLLEHSKDRLTLPPGDVKPFLAVDVHAEKWHNRRWSIQQFRGGVHFLLIGSNDEPSI